MRGVLLEVPESVLAERRRSGADRYDEMWDGVLHMNPPPTIDHQDFEYELECWLRSRWKPNSGGQVFHNIGVAPVGRWPDDFRAPDLVLVGPDRQSRLMGTRMEGGPTVAIEIRSPGDETYEKFDFHAAIDTAEVWVIDRDTKMPEIYVLDAARFSPQTANRQGWIVSEHRRATAVSPRQSGRTPAWKRQPVNDVAAWPVSL